MSGRRPRYITGEKMAAKNCVKDSMVILHYDAFLFVSHGISVLIMLRLESGLLRYLLVMAGSYISACNFLKCNRGSNRKSVRQRVKSKKEF